MLPQNKTSLDRDWNTALCRLLQASIKKDQERESMFTDNRPQSMLRRPSSKAIKENVLLEVSDLVKTFPLKKTKLFESQRYVQAVRNVSFCLKQGETLGLVGESGCGKTTLGRSILRLVDPTSGSVIFSSQDVTKMNKDELKAFRRNAQMIFQNPLSSLNPRMNVASLLEEPFIVHGMYSKSERTERIEQLLSKVGLDPGCMNRFPHQFSGGQRQRIGIARALMLQPQIIVADEPIAALDVSIQAQIINLLIGLQEEFHISFVFITHDLSVVRHIADTVGIMYLGQLVETSSADIIMYDAFHPYTRSLISAIPEPYHRQNQGKRTILRGDVPSPIQPPLGCSFHTRCPMAWDICSKEPPQLVEVKAGHFARCHLAYMKSKSYCADEVRRAKT